MKILRNLTLLAILFAFTQCKKTPPSPGEPPAGPSSIEKGASIQRTIIGLVVDEFNQPLANASVNVEGIMTQTDEEGLFIVDNASLFEDHSYIKVSSPGYFDGSRSFIPTTGVNKLKIRMLPKKKVAEIDADQGGTASFNNVMIEFPGAFVDASGNPYSGKVQVAATYIDPLSSTLGEEMPGSLRAVGTDGEAILETFGMIGVELTDLQGNEVKIAEGEEASIRMPIPSSLISEAPQEVPLWHFNEDHGYWEEEGSAEKVGNEYVGTVSHFSFWNVDVNLPPVTITGRLLTEDSSLLAGVVLEALVRGRYGLVFTGSDGTFSIVIPQGTTIKFTITGGVAGSGSTAIQLGPFNEDTDLGDIILDIELATISGTIVDCDGNPESGSVLLEGFTLINTDDGEFEFPFLTNTSFTLKVRSEDGNSYGEAMEVQLGTQDLDLGDISYCKQRQAQWLDDVIMMQVRYAVVDKNGNRDSFNVVSVSVYEDYENNVLKMKLGKANGHNADEYITLEINNYNGIGTYACTSTNSNSFNLYTGNASTTSLNDYDIDVEVLKVDVGKGGDCFLNFTGSFKEYNPNTSKDELKSIENGQIWFRFF